MQVLDNESNNIVISQNSNGFWLNFHKIPKKNPYKYITIHIACEQPMYYFSEYSILLKHNPHASIDCPAF